MSESEDKSLESEIKDILQNHVSKRVYESTVKDLTEREMSALRRAEEAERKAAALENRLIDSAQRNTEHIATIAALRQELWKNS